MAVFSPVPSVPAESSATDSMPAARHPEPKVSTIDHSKHQCWHVDLG